MPSADMETAARKQASKCLSTTQEKEEKQFKLWIDLPLNINSSGAGFQEPAFEMSSSFCVVLKILLSYCFKWKFASQTRHLFFRFPFFSCGLRWQSVAASITSIGITILVSVSVVWNNWCIEETVASFNCVISSSQTATMYNILRSLISLQIEFTLKFVTRIEIWLTWVQHSRTA